MRNFSYVKIKDTDELLQRLNERNGRIWAGGTDFMLKLKHNMTRPGIVFDISCVKELCNISSDGDYMRIGSCVKLAEIVNSKLIKDWAPLLVMFAGNIGSMEVRNVGTIGGNICASRANCGVCFLPGCRAMTGDRSTRPCRNAAYADMLLPLKAYGASVVIKSNAGERHVLIKDFFKGDGGIDLNVNEVLTEVLLQGMCKGHFGMAELRQPLKMGFPYISVIARRRSDSYDLTIGGSTKKIYSFQNVCRNNINSLCGELEFVGTLQLSEGYRNSALSSVMQEAIDRAGQE